MSIAAERPVLAKSKAQRVERILEAARELIRERGEAGLSLRLLAERAAVAAMTPYNLIGTKDKILLRLLQESSNRSSSKVRLVKGKFEVDRIFSLADYYERFIKTDPALTRVLVKTYFAIGDTRERNALDAPRRELWTVLIQRAANAGELRPDVDVRAYLILLDMLLADSTREWTTGGSDPEQFAAKLRYAFAASIAAVADDKILPHVHEQMRRAQAKLIEIRSTWDRWKDPPTISEAAAAPYARAEISAGIEP
jgi:AcrR family transcriptional regulator